jgi:hypothetical protein
MFFYEVVFCLILLQRYERPSPPELGPMKNNCGSGFVSKQ